MKKCSICSDTKDARLLKVKLTYNFIEQYSEIYICNECCCNIFSSFPLFENSLQKRECPCCGNDTWNFYDLTELGAEYRDDGEYYTDSSCYFYNDFNKVRFVDRCSKCDITISYDKSE